MGDLTMTPETLLGLYNNGHISEDFYNQYKAVVDENKKFADNEGVAKAAKEVADQPARTPGEVQPIVSAKPEEVKAMAKDMKADPMGLLPPAGPSAFTTQPSTEEQLAGRNELQQAQHAGQMEEARATGQRLGQAAVAKAPPIAPSPLAAPQGPGLPANAPPGAPTMGSPPPARPAPYPQGNPAMGALPNRNRWLSPNEVQREKELNRQAEAGTELAMVDNAINDKYDEQKYQAMQKEVENQRVMASERQRFQEDHYAQITQSMTKLQEESDRLAKETIDPNRYWNSKSTGDKVLSIFASALGGMAGGKDQNNNRALNILQDNIQRDIQAQAFNIQNRRTGVKERAGLLSQRWDQFKDMDLAKKAAMVDSYQILQQQLTSLAAGSQSEHTKANYAKLSEQLTATQETLRFDFQQTADQRAQAYAMEQARMRAASASAAAARARKKDDDLMAEFHKRNNERANMKDAMGNPAPLPALKLEEFTREYEGFGNNVSDKPTGGIATTDADGYTVVVQPNSKEAASEIEKVEKLRTSLRVTMQRRAELLDKYGTQWSGEGGDLLASNNAQLEMIAKDIYKLGGALSEGEDTRVKVTVANPSAFTSGWGIKTKDRIKKQDDLFYTDMMDRLDAEQRPLIRPGTVSPTKADLGIRKSPEPPKKEIKERAADPIGIEQYSVLLREQDKSLTPREARQQAELIMNGKQGPPESESETMAQVRERRGARKSKYMADATPEEARSFYE